MAVNRTEVYEIVREVLMEIYLAAGSQTELDVAAQKAIKLCETRIENQGERN